MEISLLLVQQIGKLFLMILMGFAIVRSRLLKPTDSKVLSVIALYVVTPCVIIDSYQVDFTAEKMQGLALAAACAIGIHILYIGLSALLGKALKLSAVEKASAAYANGGNLIIPLVSAIFGREWVLYTSAFIAVQTVLHWTHCRSLLSGGLKGGLLPILKNVNIIAIVVGCALFASGLRFPSMISSTISSVGGMIGPISMLVTGMLLGGFTKDKLRLCKRVPLICLLRLIVYPALVLIVYKLTPLRTLVPDGDTILLISFLAAAAPTAARVTNLSQLYGDNAEYAGVINMTTTLLCIISMPLMVLLYQL